MKRKMGMHSFHLMQMKQHAYELKGFFLLPKFSHSLKVSIFKKSLFFSNPLFNCYHNYMHHSLLKFIVISQIIIFLTLYSQFISSLSWLFIIQITYIHPCINRIHHLILILILIFSLSSSSSSSSSD